MTTVVVSSVHSHVYNTTAQPSCLNNASRPHISASVDLLPVDELRAVVADRKHIVVHVIVDVGEMAPPRGQITNCDNTSRYG